MLVAQKKLNKKRFAVEFTMNHFRAFWGLGVPIILVSGTLARTQSEAPGLLSPVDKHNVNISRGIFRTGHDNPSSQA